MLRLQIRPPTPEETPRIVELLSRGETEMRRQLITASVSGALNNPYAKTIGLVAVSGKEVVGATIASALPAGTGVLTGLRVSEDAPAGAAADLYGVLAKYLKSLGVTFLQSTCAIDGPAAELQEIGFEHLADLDYLSLAATGFVPPENSQLTFQLADSLPESDLASLVSQTYQGTQDCAGMSEYRNADETLASYRASPNHDPSAWRIALFEGEPAACVLGLPFADSSLMELTYMGVIPECRGKGFGALLVGEITRQAIERELSEISLGVDRTNAPAQLIYNSLGFSRVYAAAVWGIKVPTANAS